MNDVIKATVKTHNKQPGKLEWRVLVVDREEDITSSKVAAGLVTPITGKNLTKSWRVDEFLPTLDVVGEHTVLFAGEGEP